MQFITQPEVDSEPWRYFPVVLAIEGVGRIVPVNRAERVCIKVGLVRNTEKESCEGISDVGVLRSERARYRATERILPELIVVVNVLTVVDEVAVVASEFHRMTALDPRQVVQDLICAVPRLRSRRSTGRLES